MEEEAGGYDLCYDRGEIVCGRGEDCGLEEGGYEGLVLDCGSGFVLDLETCVFLGVGDDGGRGGRYIFCGCQCSPGDGAIMLSLSTAIELFE